MDGDDGVRGLPGSKGVIGFPGDPGIQGAFQIFFFVSDRVYFVVF